MVHNDPLPMFYLNAALIAFQNGVPPSGWDHPRSTEWTDGGEPDVYTAVADAAVSALRVAWNQKYNVGLRIRPEVYAQRYELAKNNRAIRQAVPGLKQLRQRINKYSQILERVRNANPQESSYLKLLFPEGSPTHPSTPAGHATVAGACVTVLKAMLATHEPGGALAKWVDAGRQAVHSIDGDSLVPYAEDDAAEMTVVGELNKLASNVALGRDHAGVHYRVDGDSGILTGEEFAITFLIDRAKEMWVSDTDLFPGWRLSKFDGSEVLITQDGATPI